MSGSKVYLALAQEAYSYNEIDIIKFCEVISLAINETDLLGFLSDEIQLLKV